MAELDGFTKLKWTKLLAKWKQKREQSTCPVQATDQAVEKPQAKKRGLGEKFDSTSALIGWKKPPKLRCERCRTKRLKCTGFYPCDQCKPAKAKCVFDSGCDYCIRRQKKCDKCEPCSSCVARNLECKYSFRFGVEKSARDEMNKKSMENK